MVWPRGEGKDETTKRTGSLQILVAWAIGTQPEVSRKRERNFAWTGLHTDTTQQHVRQVPAGTVLAVCTGLNRVKRRRRSRIGRGSPH